MALPIVLAFATIMAAVSVFLTNTTMNANKQIQTSLAQLQSYFIARAGVEHAMLKVKYLNRELYDGVCMSQGRNPLFNYSAIKPEYLTNPWKAIDQYNPGPIYMYKRGEYTHNGLISNGLPDSSKNWVNTFKHDITSINEKLNINKFLNINNLSASVRGGYIKNAMYEVDSFEVPIANVREVGSFAGSSRIENHIMVKFVIKSTLNTNKNESFDYKITRTAKIDRN